MRVTEQAESRTGKVRQRWALDPAGGQLLRLVAGCVPILSDSRIILIGSSSGDDWLLPKGGWEDDERLEEGAIRESYEEAGVLGLLGPKVDTFRAETRKARRRRLESLPCAGNSNISASKMHSTDHFPTEPCDLTSLQITKYQATKEEPHTHVCMS
eukprot:CAMPEP_0176006832 /NCGR_PEP_ID=MMETSP0120_2-20121206/2923_1 /TAXON_ID=160619 /ORGANISM="Kryptoperidinium foliaceum, Strain CCMP 1326" /LENGTH=155 /DNA_ID=CAMNT_0017339579 /DNA_START=137 /DNA_END=601 /DNA_ORIENTATION=-